MRQKLESMTLEEIQNIKLLGLDDTIPFDCKGCGKCCKGRTDLILTPYDVFRIARYLGRTNEEILKSYCHVYEGPSSRLPIVRATPRPPDNSCPFLHNKKCIVHEDKPVVCRVFPLARMSTLDGKRGYYLDEVPKCGCPGRVTVIRDWVGNVASEECDLAWQAWTETMTRLMDVMRNEINRKAISANYEAIHGAMFSLLYLEYDIKADFPEQFGKNSDVLLKTLTEHFGVVVPSSNKEESDLTVGV
jgi:Fe-S-cluster containining protein